MSLATTNYIFLTYTTILAVLYLTLSNIEPKLAGIGVVHLISMFLELKNHSNFRSDQIFPSFINHRLYISIFN